MATPPPIPNRVGKKPLTKQTVYGYMAMNLLATPGLGTWLGGRRIAGMLELGAALLGCVFILKWLLSYVMAAVNGGHSDPHLEWQFGVALFAAGWLGSLWSSIKLLRSVSAPPPL